MALVSLVFFFFFVKKKKSCGGVLTRVVVLADARLFVYYCFRKESFPSQYDSSFFLVLERCVLFGGLGDLLLVVLEY